MRFDRTSSPAGFSMHQIDFARTQAEQRGCTNIRFDVGDVLHLPYPDATFDGVFGHTILMQFQEPLPMLTEVYRVVKPGGGVGFREVAFDGNLYEPPGGLVNSTICSLTGCYRTTAVIRWLVGN